MINVNTGSSTVGLQVSGCSNLESVHQGQVLQAGDPVYFRGAQGSGNTLQLNSLTCVWFMLKNIHKYP